MQTGVIFNFSGDTVKAEIDIGGGWLTFEQNGDDQSSISIPMTEWLAFAGKITALLDAAIAAEVQDDVQ